MSFSWVTHKSLYSKGTKGCPVTPVIKLHAVIFYVVPSEDSFQQHLRCYMLRAKNINSVSEENIFYKPWSPIIYVVFHFNYLNMAILCYSTMLN